MAVATQNSKIFQFVIFVVAIYMIQLQRYRLSKPGAQIADFTAVLLDALLN
jgi:hypothetical protein